MQLKGCPLRDDVSLGQPIKESSQYKDFACIWIETLYCIAIVSRRWVMVKICRKHELVLYTEAPVSFGLL